MNPAHVLPSCSYKIHFSILPPKGLSSGKFFSPPPPPTKDLYYFFLSHICAKFLAYFTAINLFTKGFITMKRLSGNRKSKFPQDTLLYAEKFTIWYALNIIGFVKPVLGEDVVHWKRHGAFRSCQEWLLVSRRCLINQLECGHSDWYCSWIWNDHFHARVLGNGDHDWFEARFEAVLKIIPIAVAFSKRRHWSTGADISRLQFSCTYSPCCSGTQCAYSALLLTLSWHYCY
jgi:hypothetical protein